MGMTSSEIGCRNRAEDFAADFYSLAMNA